MKFLRKLVTGLVVAGSAWSLSTVTAFAAAANLCPDQFSQLCTANIGVAQVVVFAINALLFIAFVAALVFLIYGGIRWIVSGGDKENTAKAKATVTAALIGLAIVLAAWIIMRVITGLFNIADFT